MSLSIRDTDGNLLSLSDHLFSGAVEIGSGTYSGVARLYNNYDGDPNIAHVKNIRLWISPVSGSVKIPTSIGDPYRDIRTVSMMLDRFSGVCTVASQQSGTDPSVAMRGLVSGVYYSGANIILASGSNNFNEYRFEASIPSGTVLDTTSGTIFFHIEYETWLP